MIWGVERRRAGGGVRGGRKDDTLSSGEWILLYEKACRLIGRPFMPRSLGAEKAKRSATSRIREGFSRAQLIEAVGYAAEIWEGDRWSQWKNLVYIWGSNLDTILSTRGEVGKRAVSDARFTKGEERREMRDEATRRVARQIEEQDRAATERKRQPTLDQLGEGGS